MNAKNFDALVRINQNYHTDRLKEAQTARLLHRNSVPVMNHAKWVLTAVLFVISLVAGIS